jgi:hypothetical protein
LTQAKAVFGSWARALALSRDIDLHFLKRFPRRRSQPG